MLHSLSRDRGEADWPVFSQILLAFYEDGNDICFFFLVIGNLPRSSHLF